MKNQKNVQNNHKFKQEKKKYKVLIRMKKINILFLQYVMQDFLNVRGLITMLCRVLAL